MSENQIETKEQKKAPTGNENQNSGGGRQNSANDNKENENKDMNEAANAQDNQATETIDQSKKEAQQNDTNRDQSSKNNRQNKSDENGSDNVYGNDPQVTYPSENDSDAHEENSRERGTDEDDELQEESKPNWFLRLILIGAALVILILLLIFGIVPRISRNRETAEAAEKRQNALPAVNFAKPQLAPETSGLVLPGTTQAVQETAVNARASGYITKRYVDIGDRVKAGQILAELDTPEIDEQLRQAKQQVAQAQQQVAGALQEVAQARQQLNQGKAGLQTTNALLKQARTNQQLANITSRRSTNLAQKGLVSQQEADQNQAALDARKADTEVAIANIGDRQANIGAQEAVINTKLAGVSAQQANVRALEANVRRLEDLQGFRRITAPFSGIITARNVDVGGLVSGTSSSSASTSGTDSSTGTSTSGGSAAGGASNAIGGLFRIARLDAMRAYINVPQTFASAISPGLITEVDIKELPQRHFEGRVSRTSNSLDPNSRTLLTEVLISNESGQLLPGMYAQIKVDVPRPVRAVMIPSSALISRANGTSVIVINPDNTIHYQQVEIGRDYGKQIEIIGGLGTENAVVTNPTDSLQDNAQVEAHEAPPDKSDQPGGNQQNQPKNNQSGQPPNAGGTKQ